jgi:hypothetical protein
MLPLYLGIKGGGGECRGREFGMAVRGHVYDADCVGGSGGGGGEEKGSEERGEEEVGKVVCLSSLVTREEREEYGERYTANWISKPCFVSL